MVLITLAIAGAVLAHQKIEKRKEARSLLQEQNLAASRLQREEEAFAELQSYANFQSSLSSKVLDDIETESIHSAHDGEGDENGPPPRYSYAMRGYEQSFLLLEAGGQNHVSDERMIGYRSSLPYGMDVKRGSLLSSYSYTASLKAQLRSPLVILQESDAMGTQCWNRTYPASLMECGITQSAFLDFIDSFNTFLQTYPDLTTINTASINTLSQTTSHPATNLAIPESSLSTKLSAALPLAKSLPLSQSNTFLNRANEALFGPHGLFALVVSFRPDDSEEALSVDFNHSPSHNLKVDAALSLLALNTSTEPSPRSSYASSHETQTSTAHEFSQTYPFRPSPQAQAQAQALSPSMDTDTDVNPPLATKTVSSSTLQTLVTTLSTANSQRKDSRRLKKRKNDVLGVGMGLGNSSSSGSMRVEKRPASVSSFSSGLSGRMGVMGLGPATGSMGTRDSFCSIERDQQKDEIVLDFQLQPGALYLLIVNDPDHDQGFES